MRFTMLAALCLTSFLAAPASAQLTIQSVNEAAFPLRRSAKIGPHQIVKAQVLLDRAKFSPGAIDGRDGRNLRQAIAAFKQARGLTGPARIDQELWDALTQSDQDGVLVAYVITEDDVRGPFAPNLPEDLEGLQDVDKPLYRNVREMLAERFHMSEELLDQLNPRKTFSQAGTEIIVPKVGDDRLNGRRIAKIEVDKARLELRAFDRDGDLVAYYPTSIGSSDRPTPSGTLTVRTVVTNPNYTYNPRYRFSPELTRAFLIDPGPNNPVGTVWISLSRGDGYGIHGTSDPRNVGKSFSHGCVRLTNWDAQELASGVRPGARVVFLENGQPTVDENGAGAPAAIVEERPRRRRVVEERSRRRRVVVERSRLRRVVERRRNRRRG